MLIADAFDEDVRGHGRGRERLSEILDIMADFKSVIITCRSQYFVSDDAIPRETPLPVLVPRKIGQSPTFPLVRSFISPFSKQDVDNYISRHFPIIFFWKWSERKRAISLVESVPDLAHRPMLLERLPELASRVTGASELYDLYDILVDGWITRESRWISEDSLRAVSIELALRMYEEFEEKSGRMKPEEIFDLARTKLGESPDWNHLTSRSLLNRDSRGNYKFAHKSILEFIVVKAACEGDDRALSNVWTPFMKDIFISWGHSDSGKGRRKRAQSILKSKAGRENITPLFDMMGSSAVRGIPDFKRLTDRKFTVTGDRIAPPSWRSSSIDIINDEGRGIIDVFDAEYNLRWHYIPTVRTGDDIVPAKLMEVLKFIDPRPDYRLPSYEQFITLVDGLCRIDRNIIPDGVMFLLEDKPARHEHIIVQVNSDLSESLYLKIIDKQRKISGTRVSVNTYITGVNVAANFASKVEVHQLYISDPDPFLFHEEIDLDLARSIANKPRSRRRRTAR